jgi:Type IIA topoisomerase (DNA gyrase/topo II, topoisomerase IV), A subunit
MGTALGTVKKTPLEAFGRVLRKGIIAVGLDDGDYLIGAAITDGQHDVMLFSDSGKAVRFDENDVRRWAARRAASRHAARRRPERDCVAGGRRRAAVGADRNRKRLRQAHADHRVHASRARHEGDDRIQTSERNGKVVAATLVDQEAQIMLITNTGVLIRTRVSEIREMGRATQGVTLISLDEGTKLSGLQQVAEAEADVMWKATPKVLPKATTAVKRVVRPDPRRRFSVSVIG